MGDNLKEKVSSFNFDFNLKSRERLTSRKELSVVEYAIEFCLNSCSRCTLVIVCPIPASFGGRIQNFANMANISLHKTLFCFQGVTLINYTRYLQKFTDWIRAFFARVRWESRFGMF